MVPGSPFAPPAERRHPHGNPGCAGAARPRDPGPRAGRLRGRQPEVPGRERAILPRPARRRVPDALLLPALDEVQSFRMDRGGAQALYGIRPDLSCFAKVIGGGFPVGAFGGRKDLMAQLNTSTGRGTSPLRGGPVLPVHRHGRRRDRPVPRRGGRVPGGARPLAPGDRGWGVGIRGRGSGDRENRTGERFVREIDGRAPGSTAE